MSNLARIWVCILAAILLGNVGFIVGAIFGPLIFPLSLTDETGPENSTVILMLICALLSGAVGAALSWIITARYAKSVGDAPIDALQVRPPR